ncbi:hypothetical protein HRS9122_00172 [Pyrenophora teres f. teres]|nr:hypothetical protein HRS9122_00172 [Pyrenophora teres f. teres]
MPPPRLRTAPAWRIHHPSRPQRRLFHPSPCRQDAPRPSEDEVARARAYCANLVRTYDAPSHVLQTFIPQSSRDAYLAIRAFNVDVARVADTTSTPTIGMMCMQFWRDTVTKALAGTPPKEPVAILLAQAADQLHERSRGKARLSKNWFHRIINTREQHLGNPPYPTLGALESYAENTYSTMLYLTLSALPQASLTTDHIASHIGKAMGITAQLHDRPIRPHTRRRAPPLDVMAEANVREEDVFRQGASAPGLRDAIFTVATRANDHLITAREMLSKLRSEGTLGHDFEHQHEEEHVYSAQQLNTGQETQLAEVEQAFGVFMPSIATQSWLDRLQKVDFDVFDQRLRTVDWKLPVKAYWAYSRRRI